MLKHDEKKKKKKVIFQWRIIYMLSQVEGGGAPRFYLKFVGGPSKNSWICHLSSNFVFAILRSGNQVALQPCVNVGEYTT